ncbi:hypothetical protein SAMN05216391_10466 [Lachnospiraceae bacterium KHCPX20]|nr:hypothetical protein SAMN05216391_10466 [Lachnospiraceae bacterium KHCPX20]
MNRPHPKMPASQRAKQFLPFSALRGLDEALRKVEDSLEQKERPVLSEESREQLDEELSCIYKDYLSTRTELARLRHQETTASTESPTLPVVTVTYYDHGICRQLTGVLCKLNPSQRMLQVVKTKIAFEDLLEIHKGNSFS